MTTANRICAAVQSISLCVVLLCLLAMEGGCADRAPTSKRVGGVIEVRSENLHNSTGWTVVYRHPNSEHGIVRQWFRDAIVKAVHDDVPFGQEQYFVVDTDARGRDSVTIHVHPIKPKGD